MYTEQEFPGQFNKAIKTVFIFLTDHKRRDEHKYTEQEFLWPNIKAL